MSSILSIGSSGLRVQEMVLAVSAHNVANASTDGFKASRGVSHDVPGAGVKGSVLATSTPGPMIQREGALVEGSNTNLVEEATTRIAAMAAYRANLAVVRTASEMARHLVDLYA